MNRYDSWVLACGECPPAWDRREELRVPNPYDPPVSHDIASPPDGFLAERVAGVTWPDDWADVMFGPHWERLHPWPGLTDRLCFVVRHRMRRDRYDAHDFLDEQDYLTETMNPNAQNPWWAEDPADEYEDLEIPF